MYNLGGIKPAMKNKKAVSTPILLLVICTIVISGLGLIYFHALDKRNREIIYTAQEIDSVMIYKEVTRVYLEGVFKQTSEDFQSEEGSVMFIEKFKKNLAQLKDATGRYPAPQLETIVATLTKDSFSLTKNSFIITIPVVFEYAGEPKIKYTTRYRFEKIFKESSA